jgi:hypothetical protein
MGGVGKTEFPLLRPNFGFERPVAHLKTVRHLDQTLNLNAARPTSIGERANQIIKRNYW